MQGKLILTNDYVWIEFLKVGIHVPYMLDTGYPDPYYQIRIGYRTDNVGGVFMLINEPVTIRSEFHEFSRVLGDFCTTKQLIDTGGAEDSNYSFIGYPVEYDHCKIFLNLGLHLIFPDLDHCSTSGELAVQMYSSWDIIYKFAWQLQAEELRTIIIWFDLLIQEYQGFGLEKLRADYQAKLMHTTDVVENWDNIEIPPFEPIKFQKISLPNGDHEKRKRIYAAHEKLTEKTVLT